MGKKSRKSRKPDGQAGGTSTKGPLDSAIDTVAHLLKLSDEQKLPIETYFLRHDHSVSSCDGDGCYNIISLFMLNPAHLPPWTPEQSVITVCCIRCHDNIRNTVFLPTDVFQQKDIRELSLGSDVGANKSSEEYYRYFVEHQQNTTGCGFRPAPYQQCSKLVSDCLLRMKSQNKVLNGKEERTVVRLFGLESRDSFHPKEIRPEPAPDVNTLWLTITRPEYFFFHLSEDLFQVFGCEPGERLITSSDFEKSLSFILKDEYRRIRLLAMLDHMAMWHMLGNNEEEVASWLLWERKSMMVHAVSNPATIDAMKNNIILQLMVNKFFDGNCGDLLHPQFPNLDLYGEGIGSFFYYKQHMANTANLPPAFIVTATVARGVGSISSDNNADAERVDVENDICTTIKSLKIKRSSCAVCGATRSTSGGRLSVCSKCESVAYCCQEHHTFHWKKGGHKQQCSK